MIVSPAYGQDDRWSVGEFACGTGLSVRVLRHWDEIGLVSPQRTAGGHRCYTSADVTHLCRALALRHMGVPNHRAHDYHHTGGERTATITATATGQNVGAISAELRG